MGAEHLSEHSVVGIGRSGQPVEGFTIVGSDDHHHRAVRSERRSDGLDHASRATVNRADCPQRCVHHHRSPSHITECAKVDSQISRSYHHASPSAKYVRRAKAEATDGQ
jgi:hypothetical protein